jgi:hypothetical protein
VGVQEGKLPEVDKFLHVKGVVVVVLIKIINV